MNGIDVSHWNEVTSFIQVRNQYNFVILKAGGSDAGFYKDKTFEKYYYQAKVAGLYVGAYYFVGKDFLGAESGRKDAERFYNLLKGKIFEMPVYVDIETTPSNKRQLATDAAIAFCKYMESKGAFVGIYASDVSGFYDRLVLNRLTNYSKWVARYGGKPKVVDKYAMWQFSSTGKVQGIRGNVDLNLCYENFPAIMRQKGLNYFT